VKWFLAHRTVAIMLSCSVRLSSSVCDVIYCG